MRLSRNRHSVRHSKALLRSGSAAGGRSSGTDCAPRLPGEPGRLPLAVAANARTVRVAFARMGEGDIFGCIAAVASTIFLCRRRT